MTRRAYSPREVVRRTYRTIEWGEPWSGPFGHPVWTETWFVSGQSASGKSSFVMQLCKELCRHAGVLYVSLEEGVSQSFKARMERFRMTEVQGAFRVVVNETWDELAERLARRKSPHFVVIDSFQMTGWSYEQTMRLVQRFGTKSFIFVSQEYKGQPMGKAAARLRYIAGMKVRVVGFRAFCMGRYTEDPGSSYTVWEEGVMRTTNNID